MLKVLVIPPRDTNGAEYVTVFAYVPPQTITKLYIVSKHLLSPRGFSFGS